MVTEREIMNQTQTHSISKRLDSEGNPWYQRDQYDYIEIGKRFNVFKLNDGMVQYEMKDENGIVHTFVAEEDRSCLYSKSFKSSGMPSILREKYLKDFDIEVYPKDQLLAKEAGKRAKNYIRNFNELAKDGMGLFIYSGSETSGKTYLAAIVANELMKRYGVSVKFVKAITFFAELKRYIGNEKRDPYAKNTFNSCLESAIKAGILIMDDIGSGQQSDYISDLISEIITKRVNANRVTIITSKRSFSQLPYDNSTLMLIQEKCLKVVLPSVNVGKDIVKEKNSKYEELLNA